MDKVAVIGGGFASRVWAIVFARAGLRVSLFEAAQSDGAEALRSRTGVWPSTAAADLNNRASTIKTRLSCLVSSNASFVICGRVLDRRCPKPITHAKIRPPR